MKPSFVFLIAIAICVGLFTPSFLRAERVVKTPSVVWEYKVTQELTEEDMSELGKQGWELAGIMDANVQARFYYKRQVKK